MGDSIAVGLAAALAAVGPHACDSFARKGAGTTQISALVPTGRYEVAIVSAGTNDSADPALRTKLKRLRATIKAKRVVWIYPRSAQAAWAVYEAALSFGDGAVAISYLASDDDIHPRDYRAVARRVATRVWMAAH